MPDVPANALPRRDAVREAVHVAIGVVERFVPEPLPGHDLRVFREQPPEGHEGPVYGRRARLRRHASPADSVRPCREREVALAGAVDVDAVLPRRVHAILAEAGDAAAGALAAVVGDERVAQRALPLA